MPTLVPKNLRFEVRLKGKMDKDAESEPVPRKMPKKKQVFEDWVSPDSLKNVINPGFRIKNR